MANHQHLYLNLGEQMKHSPDLEILPLDTRN